MSLSSPVYQYKFIRTTFSKLLAQNYKQIVQPYCTLGRWCFWTKLPKSICFDLLVFLAIFINLFFVIIKRCYSLYRLWVSYNESYRNSLWTSSHLSQKLNSLNFLWRHLGLEWLRFGVQMITHTPDDSMLLNDVGLGNVTQSLQTIKLVLPTSLK